ncbi:MAG: RICIN domain-containing protein [Prolixibacteraceae bacterium]|jgi:enterochelin esterase-like enzyme/lysophospholipase L1-like esterase|nr:RICIN domain-containing protein [Prolixibacteraceae bacterium]
MKKIASLAILIVSVFASTIGFAITSNPILSRGKTVYTSSGTVSYLTDNKYGGSTLSVNDETWLAINIGTGYSRLYFTWNNPNYSWSDVISSSQSCKQNMGYPVNYSILTSSNSTDGLDGTWTTVETVSGNSVTARGISIDFSSQSWIKMSVSSTSSNGGGAIDEIEVFDLSNGGDDLWFFPGTSISANTYKGTPPANNFADLVSNAHSGYTPAMVRGGIPCIVSGHLSNNINDYINVTPDVKYFAIEMGTNDAWGGGTGNLSSFITNMQEVITACKNAGIQPIIARLLATNSSAAGWQVNPAYLSAIDNLTSLNGLIAGPDLYTYFVEHPNELDNDGVHPNATGAASIQRLWAEKMSSLYSGACAPTSITPNIQVNDGDWKETFNVTVKPGDQVKIGSKPSSEGSWKWNGGCGTSGTSREQTIYPTDDCDVVATFTNSCGEKSTQTFQIRMYTPCSATDITPYIQVNDGTWQQTSTVTVASGAKVILGPQPVTESLWSWNGDCGTSGNSREQTIYPTVDCDIVATYTNTCGEQSTKTFQIKISDEPSGETGGTNTLPSMPAGGPDNGTYDKSDRYPAGSVSTVNFYSSVAGKNVDMLVYTPPGYSTSQKYGVIFCYQGMGDKASSVFNGAWVKAGIVCDNLIGEGKVSKGVIIVAVDDQFNTNGNNVNDMTILDAIPYIDSTYSTYADADHRGLFGYSLGGGHTFNVACNNMDYFHFIGPSSAAPNKQADATLFPNGGETAKQVMKLLFISWAEYDYQIIIDDNVAAVNYCNTNNIPNYSWAAKGQGHSGGTWRPAMWNFLQLADQAGISADSCLSTAITPYIQVNDGAWQETFSVTVKSGDKVKLSPQPSSEGSWNWKAGCSISDTSREQTIYPTEDCDALATYINSCGTQSTLTFQIRISGSTPGILSGGPYIFKARHSGKVLNVTKSGTDDGTNVDQSTNKKAASQSWTLTDLGNRYYQVSPAHDTSKCLDVSGGSFADGANIQIWAYENDTSQQWQFVNVDKDYYQIKIRNSGKCLDIIGASKSNGGNAQLSTCNSSYNQQWKINPQEIISGLATMYAEKNDVLFYPNPFTSETNLKIENPVQVISIKVIDMMGRQMEVIDHANVKNLQTIGSSLKAGIYMVQVYRSNKNQSFKIVKE